MEKSGVWLGAGAVALLAVGAFVVFDDNETACTLSGATATLVVEAVTKGRSPGTVAAEAVAPLAAYKGCQEAAERWIDDPSATVDVEIDAGAETVNEGLTFEDLVEPPPPPPSATDFGRVFDCFESYDLDWQRSLCSQGVFEPRS